MHAFDQKPHVAGEGYDDTYLEMEFGGRSGIFDLYGYVDIFDITDSTDSNQHDGANMFMKFAPRISLDALTGRDLSFGPFDEFYISTISSIDDTLFETLIGPGADVQVPWLGKVGMGVYARYSFQNDYFQAEEGGWNGYQFSMNWFKPFYTFQSGAYLSYQGYLDYAFDMDTHDTAGRTSEGGAMFNGIYYHTDRFAIGYGLKYFDNIYGNDDGYLDATGFGHYISATYKF